MHRILAGQNPQLIQHDGIRSAVVDNIQAGIDAGLFNGATVGIVTPHGREIIAHGLLQREGPELLGDEIYDWASVTKFFVALLWHILHSHRAKLLDDVGPDTLVSEIDRFDIRGPHTDALRVKHLLWYLAEFEASNAMSDMIKKGHDPIDLIMHKGLASQPGRRWVYCNHSYVMLGLLIEHLMRRKLPALMSEYIFKPLGMSETTFFPWELENSPLRRFVPTEDGLRGFVHDESAGYLMRTKRQAVGSAGLFGPIYELLHPLAMLLDEGLSPKTHTVIPKRVVRRFGVNYTPGRGESFGNGFGLYSSFTDGLEDTVSSPMAFFKNAFTGGQVVVAPRNRVGFAAFTDFLALGRRPKKGQFNNWLAKLGCDIIRSFPSHKR